MSGIPFIHIKDIFLVILNTYFWATKSGSKKSVVILWAYMEHAIREQRPAERNNRICATNSDLNQSRRSWWCDSVEQVIHSKCYIPDKSRHGDTGFFCTVDYEVEAGEDGQASLGGLRASYFRALHSYQGEDGTEETQTHRGDHQTPAHLDIGFMTEAERESALNWWFHTFLLCDR